MYIYVRSATKKISNCCHRIFPSQPCRSVHYYNDNAYISYIYINIRVCNGVNDAQKRSRSKGFFGPSRIIISVHIHTSWLPNTQKGIYIHALTNALYAFINIKARIYIYKPRGQFVGKYKYNNTATFIYIYTRQCIQQVRHLRRDEST